MLMLAFFVSAAYIVLASGCGEETVECAPLPLVPPRWDYMGLQVPNRALQCNISSECHLDLNDVVRNHTNIFNLTDEFADLNLFLNCANLHDKFDFRNTGSLPIEIAASIYLEDCNTTWDDINDLGKIYQILDVEMVHSVPRELLTYPTQNKMKGPDVPDGLKVLTYIVISFINFTGQVDLHDYLPFMSLPMNNIGYLGVQCTNAHLISTRGYCHAGMVTFNSTRLRMLFPHLQTLALSGVYPLNNESLDFAWYPERIKAPLNFTHAPFYLMHSTTENYRANRSVYVYGGIPRILSINGLYGVPPESLCPLQRNLETIVIQSCNISHIPLDCINPSESKPTTLYHLDLSYNSLTTLHMTVFQGLRSLERLHLAYGFLEDLPDGIFDDQENLKVLNLNYNQIKFLRKGIFSKLCRLKSLFIHNNKIASVEVESLPTYSDHLTFVDIRDNQLTTVPRDCLTLPYLHNCDCDRNNITLEDFEEIFTYFNPVKMLFVQAAAYYGGTFNYADVGLMHESDQSEISIRDNPLQSVEFNKTWSRYKRRALAAFFSFFELTLEQKRGRDLHHCDCNMYHLKNFIESGEARNLVKSSVYYNILLVNRTNFQSWKCKPHKVLHMGETNATSFLNIAEEHFICEMTEDCPDRCQCFRGAKTPDNIFVDCSKNKGEIAITNLPKNIPTPQKGGNLIVDLRNNTIISVDVNCADDDYKWLKRVTTLNLEGNRGLNAKTSSSLYVFLECLENVTHLYLKDCNINHLPFPIQSLQYTEMTISGNTLSCTCEYKWLKPWLQKSAFIIDAAGAHCANQHDPILQLEQKDFICSPSIWPAVVVLICLLITLIIVGISCYVYEFELKILLFERLNWHPFDAQSRDDEKEYDAYLMYHRDDEVWVINTLRVGLERSGYKLWIGAINWTPGAANAEELTNSLKKSRRVIVVISQSFVSSVRDMSDFHFAHEYYPIQNKRRFLILVKFDENLDLEEHEVLKGYVSTNYFVPLRAKRFWSRLCYWLPPLQKMGLPASTDNIAPSNAKDYTTPL